MEHKTKNLTSAHFITFSGNCRKALSFYQDCFGGRLTFDSFEKALDGFTEKPVVCGSLIADKITIHGSDLVHDEGRRTGNYIAIFLRCKNIAVRNALAGKLNAGEKADLISPEQKSLIELTDPFEVRWVLAV